ncbi:hypothetical protein EJB05_12435, partial [Eragrostis curvula]
GVGGRVRVPLLRILILHARKLKLSKATLLQPHLFARKLKIRKNALLPPHPRSEKRSQRSFSTNPMLYYEGRVLLLDFDKLAATNKELAFTICNCEEQRRKVWLNQAAIEFFESNGLPTVDIQVHIMNLPECVADAEDVLNSNTLGRKVKLFRGKEEADLPTAQGQILFDLILCGLLEDLVKGKTYCGGLTLKDLVFARYPSGKLKLLIIKEPSIQENASNEDKALDVASVWPLLEKFYILEGGGLPFYFEELKTDLLSVTADEIGQDWFVEYLKFHIALFEMFFSGEPMARDWRWIAQGHEALQIIFYYKENQKKRGSGKERSNKKEEGKQQDNENSQSEGKCGISEALQEGRQTERGGAPAESERKQGLGKEQSGKKKVGKQQGNVNSQLGGKRGIVKETLREGIAATECKQAERAGSPAESEREKIVAESKGSTAVMEKAAPGSEMGKADMKGTAEKGQTQEKLAKEFLPGFIKGLLKISMMGGKLKRVWLLYKAAKWDGKDL